MDGFCEWCEQWSTLDPTGTHCANCLGKKGKLIEEVRQDERRAVRDALREVAKDPLAGVVDFREVVLNQVVSGWFREGGRFEVKDKT